MDPIMLLIVLLLVFVGIRFIGPIIGAAFGITFGILGGLFGIFTAIIATIFSVFTGFFAIFLSPMILLIGVIIFLLLIQRNRRV